MTGALQVLPFSELQHRSLPPRPVQHRPLALAMPGRTLTSVKADTQINFAMFMFAPILGLTCLATPFLGLSNEPRWFDERLWVRCKVILVHIRLPSICG